MGAPLSEFVFETVIRDGLGEIRSNPAILDDLFSRFLEAQFGNQYGQDQINSLKTYFQNNQIRIVQSWAMVPTTLPCFSIQMVSSEEAEELQTFSNDFEEVDEAKDPEVLITPITPGTYDPVTGKMTVTNAVDLSTVTPGQQYKDFSGNFFTIGSGNSNLSGNKYINIGKDQAPNLGGDGEITSGLDYNTKRRKRIRLKETVHIGCHSKDNIHISKYLYYVLQFILKSRQESLIERGIHLDRGTGGMFDRSDDFQGEHVFSRFLEVSYHVEFDWTQEYINLIDCFDLTVKAPSPQPDSEDTITVSPSDS